MKAIVTVIILGVLIIFAIRVFENKLIFFPLRYPQGHWEPETFGLALEDCEFTAIDGTRLHGWLAAKPEAVATVLWCHGNAGNITNRLDNLALLFELPVNVFLFDYRGYGKSSGKPNEHGAYLDAQAAYDFITSRPDLAGHPILLFGRSLGGAIAVDLATKVKCAGLILESTFTSAKDMAKLMFGWFPVHLIIKSRFDSVGKIGQLRVPILMIHGNRDEIIPFELGQRLYRAANEPKEFYEIAANHNDTYIIGGPAYFERWLKFIHEATTGPPTSAE